MKNLRTAAAIAAIGVIALFVLFPRFDPSSIFPTALDRGKAIRRARQISSKYGVAAESWKASVTASGNDKLRSYILNHPDDAAAKWLTPVSWLVVLDSPDSKWTERVQLFADGRPAQWQLLSTGRGAGELPSRPVPPETVLQDFAGPHAASFAPAGNAETGAGIHRWRWSAGKQFPLLVNLDMFEKGGRLSEVVLDGTYSEEFDASRQHEESGTVTAITGLCLFGAFCAACVLALLAVSRKTFSWRTPLVLAAVFILWGTLTVWNGPDYRAAMSSIAPPPIATGGGSQQTGYNIGVQVGYFSDLLIPLLACLAFAGAGYARASGPLRQKWTSLDQLMAGKLFWRPVSLSAAAGALYGVGIAAVPFLIAAMPPFRAGLDLRGLKTLAAPFAALRAVDLSAAVPALGFLGFAWPMAQRLRSRWLRAAAMAAVAAVFAKSAGDSFEALAPAFLTGAIIVAFYMHLYRRFDLLAVMTAMLMARAVSVPALLLSQPLGAFHEAGLAALVFLAAAIVVLVNFAMRGRTSDEVAPAVEPGYELPDTPSRSSRERLEAEFQVARRAQQDALPASPPVLEGYSFAASCEPAQQVGGDLYDFFPLADGRLGVAVADVSGKGVPAALYMMVTKGLLAAAAADSHDLVDIVHSLNTHLHRACKRRVFVTMAAIAVDPARRRLEYARAGHNPLVWRRARRGQTLMPTPPGLGLGLSGPEMFQRTLRTDVLDLEPGDAVVLYSDGITEAVNRDMEQYGEERLMRAVESTDGQPAAQSRDALLRDLAGFTAGTPARDDVTVVVLRVAG